MGLPRSPQPTPVPAPARAKDAVASAQVVGLRYVTDSMPGITRERAGHGFRFRYPTGDIVRDFEVLRRIRSLAIPPAWTDVWICPDPFGHVQATGRDDRGRKQNRYHGRWREIRDETKYVRMIGFARALPRIRRRVRKDMAVPGLPRNKVLATVVRLLEVSLIRVGNEEYARENESFGLTTMRDRHVDVRGSTLRFHFRGKSGRWHEVDVEDRRLARIVRSCQDLPGQELFQYVNDHGERQTVSSEDVNEYLRAISGQDFTAKDFRTWAGTVLAAAALQELSPFVSQGRARKNVVRAIESVAARLGNTTSVCRKCYVHPEVIGAYMDGTLVETLRQRARRVRKDSGGLPVAERAVLNLLQQRLKAGKRTLAQRLAGSLETVRRQRRDRAALAKNGIVDREAA